MMIEIHKANGSPDEIPPIMINIVKPLPAFEGEGWMLEAGKCYQDDAEVIQQALKESLPGGTYDRLVVELLKSTATFFSVPWSERER